MFFDGLVSASTSGGVSSWIDYSSAQTGAAFPGASFTFKPSVDVAIGRHLTLGGQVQFHTERIHTAFSYSETDANGDLVDSVYGTGATGSTGLLVVPRVGWRFPLTDRLTLWPRVGAGFGVVRRYSHGGVGDTASDSADGNLTFEGSVDLVASIVGPLYTTVGIDARASDFRTFGEASPNGGIYAGGHASVGLAF